MSPLWPGWFCLTTGGTDLAFQGTSPTRVSPVVWQSALPSPSHCTQMVPVLGLDANLM